ncbi:organic solute transporter Ostalpha-domain-containing protein [Jimgerdemannia flammicorona]|uniref:Organic solute transporter Ostalpha-domain-containing protein n=1 Tax=Jimgerdemannia flammicorona TaxID=994334 RepID=A0A433QTL5_9FUNG|nr:organic solute transporter Ostalpha-domain-containing protein [Jimgerdemannia flammicorona]
MSSIKGYFLGTRVTFRPFSSRDEPGPDCRTLCSSTLHTTTTMADQMDDANVIAITKPYSNDTCNPPSPGFEPSFPLSDLYYHPTAHWHVFGWIISGALVILIWILAIRAIVKHLWSYTDPDIQRHKVRIPCYPPVFAACTWLSYWKYNYRNTIMFFAILFAYFAIFNLLVLLQVYLQPYREENEGVKQPFSLKLFYILPLNIKSKWGMHYRVIHDVCMFQFPIWNVLNTLISIITQVRGVYCAESMTFKGFHVYSMILNFCSVNLILAALSIYHSAFHLEWQRAHVNATAML